MCLFCTLGKHCTADCTRTLKCCYSFTWTISPGVTSTLSVSVVSHNQHTHTHTHTHIHTHPPTHTHTRTHTHTHTLRTVLLDGNWFRPQAGVIIRPCNKNMVIQETEYLRHSWLNNVMALQQHSFFPKFLYRWIRAWFAQINFIYLISGHVHILVSRPDDEPSLGSKLVAS